jgi:hypothetical protein
LIPDDETPKPLLEQDLESFIVIATPGHLNDFEAVRGCFATQAGISEIIAD